LPEVLHQPRGRIPHRSLVSAAFLLSVHQCRGSMENKTLLQRVLTRFHHNTVRFFFIYMHVPLLSLTGKTRKNPFKMRNWILGVKLMLAETFIPL